MTPYKSVLFADDTTFIISDHDVTSLAETSIDLSNKSNRWFISNRLKLNADKTQNMLISVNNQTILHEETKSLKLLGISSIVIVIVIYCVLGTMFDCMVQVKKLKKNTIQ